MLLPLGRYDEAERDAAAAVAADPLSPVTRIHLSNIHRARGALDRAAAAVDPAAGHVQTMSRALTYSMMGRRKEVRSDTRHRSRLFPHPVRPVR